MQPIQRKTLCAHKEVVEVGKIGKATIFACGAYDVRSFIDEIDGPALLVSCAGSTTKDYAEAPYAEFSGKGAERIFGRTVRLTPKTPEYCSLSIDWADGWSPPFNMVWWQALVEDLAAFNGKALFYCQGGHGRTGLALAILAHLAEWNAPGESAVAWVRKKYCPAAIETQAQMEWLKARVGQMDDRPSRDIENELNAPVDTGGMRTGRTGLDLNCDFCEKAQALDIDENGYAFCPDCVTQSETGCASCGQDAPRLTQMGGSDLFMCDECVKTFQAAKVGVEKMMGTDSQDVKQEKDVGK